MRLRRLLATTACSLLIASLVSCGGGEQKPVVTIYTSIYENVIAQMAPLLEQQFPDIEVRWHQSGSEEIAAKVNSEIAAGQIRADIIMTSDPFWYEELKNGGYLLQYESPAASEIPEELKDPENYFVTVRMPVMVMAANSQKLTPEQMPASFQSLASPEWKNRITMGNPLQSGSMFTSVAALSEKYGWEYFEALRQNEMIAAGGNSAVLSRVSSGEKDAGIILLENLLEAKKKNPDLPVATIYPEDGSILVPSPIAIVKTSESSEAAKQIYDFMFSDEGQRAIVEGNMYSPFDKIAPPPGARPWSAVYANTLVGWSPEYLRETLGRRDEIKDQFQRIMLQ